MHCKSLFGKKLTFVMSFALIFVLFCSTSFAYPSEDTEFNVRDQAQLVEYSFGIVSDYENGRERPIEGWVRIDKLLDPQSRVLDVTFNLRTCGQYFIDATGTRHVEGQTTHTYTTSSPNFGVKYYGNYNDTNKYFDTGDDCAYVGMQVIIRIQRGTRIMTLTLDKPTIIHGTVDF